MAPRNSGPAPSARARGAQRYWAAWDAQVSAQIPEHGEDAAARLEALTQELRDRSDAVFRDLGAGRRVPSAYRMRNRGACVVRVGTSTRAGRRYVGLTPT